MKNAFITRRRRLRLLVLAPTMNRDLTMIRNQVFVAFSKTTLVYLMHGTDPMARNVF